MEFLDVDWRPRGHPNNDAPGRIREFAVWQSEPLLGKLSWELDFFGRRKKEKQAAKADLLATEEARLAVVITLIGDIATAYYNLRELDFELEIAKRTLTSRQSSLRIIRLRQERGVSNLLELRQAEELVYDATEVIPAVEQAMRRKQDAGVRG